MPGKTIYDQDYINLCFNEWYLHGRPANPNAIRKLLPEHPTGRTPSLDLIKRWVIYGAWDTRADELDAKVQQKNDVALINTKAKMLRKHLEQAEKVSAKALEHLLLEGFDSSSAAVQAFFKGLEEQRKTQGFSDLLERLDKMTNNDVEREIIGLLNRASENDQIIDTVSEDVENETEN